MKKTAGSTGVSPASKEDPNPGTRNLELETRSCWTKPRLLATAYWRLLTLAIFAFCFAACSPTYVLRAGYEEAKILWNRRPITEVLARTDIDPTTREKLELVLRVRRFVEQELAFNVGGSYSTITELNKPPIVYVVTAAPRTKLEPYTWWFPIIGQVAYKGYFEQAEAQQEAQRLEAQGYDTYVRAAMAFSTLGWFADPLLPHLLRYGHETLANIIVHELFHSTFYLKGQSAFNESLANFAGHRGAVAFFTKEFGQEAAVTRQAQTTWDNEQAVSAFLATGVERLNALYLSSASEEEKRQQRETLFAQLQQEFRSLPGPIRQNTDFATVRLNNAVVLQYLMYLRDLSLFERIYQQQGENLRTTLERIIEAAKAKDDPFAAVHNLVGGAQHVAFFPPISLPSSAIFSPTVWVVPEEDFPPIVFDRLNNYRRSS